MWLGLATQKNGDRFSFWTLETKWSFRVSEASIGLHVHRFHLLQARLRPPHTTILVTCEVSQILHQVRHLPTSPAVEHAEIKLVYTSDQVNLDSWQGENPLMNPKVILLEWWDYGTGARQAQRAQPGLKGISAGKVCPRMGKTQGAPVRQGE